MANIALDTLQGRTDFFAAGILRNINHWQTWLNTPPQNIAMLNCELSNIARSISFGLQLEGAWQAVCKLIVASTRYMEQGEQRESWHTLLKQAVNIAQMQGDVANETLLTFLLARLSYKQSYFTHTVFYYRRAIRLACKIGDDDTKARACTNLGYYYIQQGHWWRAEVLCCYALQLFEQLNSDHGRAHTESPLGVLYTRQTQWEQAKKHLEQACIIWQNMSNKQDLIHGFINLSNLYFKLNQADLALAYLKKALHKAHALQSNLAVAIVYRNMGLVYRLQNNWVKSQTYLEQAENIFKQSSNYLEQTRTWHSLGVLFSKQKKWHKAEVYFQKSLEMYRYLGYQIDEIELLFDMVDNALERELLKQATGYLVEIKSYLNQNNHNQRYSHFYARLITYKNYLDAE